MANVRTSSSPETTSCLLLTSASHYPTLSSFLIHMFKVNRSSGFAFDWFQSTLSRRAHLSYENLTGHYCLARIYRKTKSQAYLALILAVAIMEEGRWNGHPFVDRTAVALGIRFFCVWSRRARCSATLRVCVKKRKINPSKEVEPIPSAFFQYDDS
jgi:hypothetical protein